MLPTLNEKNFLEKHLLQISFRYKYIHTHTHTHNDKNIILFLDPSLMLLFGWNCIKQQKKKNWYFLPFWNKITE